MVTVIEGKLLELMMMTTEEKRDQSNLRSRLVDTDLTKGLLDAPLIKQCPIGIRD